MALKLTPTFSDFFKSLYYSNTYVPSVDLSEQEVSQYLLENENPKAAAIAQRLISEPEVRQVLSEPLTYDLEVAVPERNAALQRHGFKLLSRKPNLQTGKMVPFYSVIEHDDLQGWIIKSGATRIPKGQILVGPLNIHINEMALFTEEESLLRIEMANRIQKVAQEANIDVVIPKKKLVAYSHVDGVTDPCRKYCVLCEKINILSVEDTVQAIKKMDAEHQREIARKISTIVQKAGLVDASFDNIRLTPDGKLAFIDTEPGGLMVVKKPGLWNQLFGAKGASVEKCARIGLYSLMNQATQAMRGTAAHPLLGLSVEMGLEEFHKQVENDYEIISEPKLSAWKITLSVLSLGLIPLINIIIAFVKTILTENVFKKLRAMDAKHAEKVQKYQIENGLNNPLAFNYNELKHQETDRKILEITQDHQTERYPLAQQFFAYIEGVPYETGLV